MQTAKSDQSVQLHRSECMLCAHVFSQELLCFRSVNNLIWAASWQFQQNDCAPSEDLRSAWTSTQSDQSSLCTQWVAKDQSFLHADSKDSDQTGRMPRLIWVFTGRTVILLVFSWGSSFTLNICDNHYGPANSATCYCNDPTFSDRQVWVNSVDPDQMKEQSDQGLHCLPSHLHPL